MSTCIFLHLFKMLSQCCYVKVISKTCNTISDITDVFDWNYKAVNYLNKGDYWTVIMFSVAYTCIFYLKLEKTLQEKLLFNLFGVK